MLGGRITQESKIIQAIREDNHRGNTIHFKWDRLSETPADYFLDVITHNITNGQNFLMKRIFADSKSECLRKMVEYAETGFKDEPSWIVSWVDSNDIEWESYFRGADEDQVKDKFNYDSSAQSVILEITHYTL